jgi:predicted RNA-binding Zn-ribbon protein involved in translation (DUF1610 family)
VDVKDLADPEKFVCQRETLQVTRQHECGKAFVDAEVVIDPGGKQMNMLDGTEINVVEDRRAIDDVIRVAKKGKTIFWCPSCGLAHFLRIEGNEVRFGVCP